MSDIQAINYEEKTYTPREVPKDLPSASVFRSEWSWKTWRGFWKNIANLFHSFRPAWHRATRGTCRMDTWDLDYSVTTYLIRTLIDFRNYASGWPDQHFVTFEEWIAEIDLCIDRLIYSIQDRDKINDWYKPYQEFLYKGHANWTKEEHDIFDRYIEEDKVLYSAQCEARKKAFAFLGEYLPHLWW